MEDLRDPSKIRTPSHQSSAPAAILIPSVAGDTVQGSPSLPTHLALSILFSKDGLAARWRAAASAGQGLTHDHPSGSRVSVADPIPLSLEFSDYFQPFLFRLNRNPQTKPCYHQSAFVLVNAQRATGGPGAFRGRSFLVIHGESLSE